MKTRYEISLKSCSIQSDLKTEKREREREGPMLTPALTGGS